VDNSESRHKRLPPNGQTKGQRSAKDFPMSATTFFKTSTPAEKLFKVDTTSLKKSKSQKKLGQTL